MLEKSLLDSDPEVAAIMVRLILRGGAFSLHPRYSFQPILLTSRSTER